VFRTSIRRHVTLALLSFGKFLMYRDLDPKTWPADQSIARHPLVRELFEGSKNPNIALAEEYPIDAPKLVKDVPLLIRDADSSQHSALVHALRGQNLVIEGPPGTEVTDHHEPDCCSSCARQDRVFCRREARCS
jgi:hypothetical protein